MPIRNSRRGYGLIAILLHWFMALLIVGLFALGLYMTSLDYYSPWYRTAPDIHRGLGVIVGLLLAARLAWRLLNTRPDPEPGTPRRLATAAEWAHRALYLLIALIVASGYAISTADGRPVDVFGLFEVPALITGVENLEDSAGEIHLVLAVTLMALVGLHAAAALKHHFIDRDRTLRRMLSPRDPETDNQQKGE